MTTLESKTEGWRDGVYGSSGKFYYYYHFLIIKFHLQLNYDDCVYGHYQHRDNGD